MIVHNSFCSDWPSPQGAALLSTDQHHAHHGQRNDSGCQEMANM
jgi:hypothetical protein